MVMRRVQTRIERKRTGPESGWSSPSSPDGRLCLGGPRLAGCHGSGARHRYHYSLTPTEGSKVAFTEPSLAELARVVKSWHMH